MSVLEGPPTISVVSPVFLAETIVAELVSRIVEVVEPLGPYEIILVDDRSPDGGWLRIVQECEKNPHVRGVRLSRNSGQHAAIAAALRETTGDVVVVMDCDLQDDPVHIRALLAAAADGHDVVLTEHESREHAWFRNWAAKIYLALVGFLTHGEAESAGLGSFSLMTRKVVNAYNEIGDVHAHYLANLRYLGFDQTRITVGHADRFDGRSSYSLRRLVRHAVDGIVSNSLRLLNIVVVFGMTLFALSMLGVVYLLVSYMIRGALAGFTSLMVVLLLMSGTILMSIGVVGVYVGRVFEQGRDRPRYTIDRRVNFEDGSGND